VCAAVATHMGMQLTLHTTLCVLCCCLSYATHAHTSKSQDVTGNGISEHDDASNTHRSNDVVLDTDADGETLASKDSTACNKPSTTQVCAPASVKHVTVKNVTVNHVTVNQVMSTVTSVQYCMLLYYHIMHSSCSVNNKPVY
jgi:hypothetical protein